MAKQTDTRRCVWVSWGCGQDLSLAFPTGCGEAAGPLLPPRKWTWGFLCPPPACSEAFNTGQFQSRGSARPHRLVGKEPEVALPTFTSSSSTHKLYELRQSI